MAKTTRPQIVAAARDLMRDRGYAGTSMKELADRVGILKGSLYNHFNSKEELVPEVLDLASKEICGVVAPSSNWRLDYEMALGQIITVLIQHRRCIGFQLAYGLDDTDEPVRKAVAGFFQELRCYLRTLLEQDLDTDTADSFALETITTVEGATLWLALSNEHGPMEKARVRLMNRANSLANAPPGSRERGLLDEIMGDWRLATIGEQRFASRLAAVEDELSEYRAQLAGRIEAESCFR